MVDDRPEQTGPSPNLGLNLGPDLGPELGPDNASEIASEGEAELGRPKRAPPTIDLAATEVKTAADAHASASARESRAEHVAGAAASQAGEASPAAATPPADAIKSPPRPRRAATVSIAVVSGAMAAVLVIAIAELAGWPGQPGASDVPAPQPAVPQVSSAAFDALSARVAKVESRPAPSSATTTPPAAPDPALATRLDGLEKSIAALRSDLAAARSQSDRAAAAVNDLKSAPRDIAPPVDLTPINERLGQIERTAGALKTEAAQQSAKPADDKPLRRVVAASLLDGSVRQGEPYPAALTQAKSLAVDANTLKPLDAFAASGVPGAATLSRELLALLPKLVPAQPSAASIGTGIMDRLQAGAAKLVRIQRTDEAAGDDRGAIVARIADAARRDDLAEAKRDTGALAAADRAVLQPWIDKLDARDAAFAASRQFAADAMAALTKPAP